MKKDNSKNKQLLAKDNAEVVAIMEKQRTIRWMVVTFGVVVFTRIIAEAVVDISKMESPPWLTLSLAITGAFAMGGSPAIIVIKWFRSFIRKYSARTEELEKKIDPSRSSSGLHADGTHPDD